MSSEATPIINEARDKVCLGGLTLHYDPSHCVIQIGKQDQEVFRASEACSQEDWDSLLRDLEEKMNFGPLLVTLRRIREMGKEAKRVKGQEERGERGSKALQPGVEAFMQFGLRVEGLVGQVLDEFERTSPFKEDESHVSMLDASTSPRGVAPPEITAALNDEAASISAQVTPLNWQVTELGDTRIVFLIYAYSDGERKGIRFAVQVNGKTDSSGVIA